MAQIHLSDDIAKALERMAHSEGFSLEQYLSQLVSQVTSATTSPLSADEFIAAIHAETSDTPVPCQGTFSRTDIYSDHD